MYLRLLSDQSLQAYNTCRHGVHGFSLVSMGIVLFKVSFCILFSYLSFNHDTWTVNLLIYSLNSQLFKEVLQYFCQFFYCKRLSSFLYEPLMMLWKLAEHAYHHCISPSLIASTVTHIHTQSAPPPADGWTACSRAPWLSSCWKALKILLVMPFQLLYVHLEL